MNFLTTHFPLVFIVVVAINAAIARRRVTRFVEATGNDEAGAIRYVWTVAAIVTAYLLALDVSGHSTNSLMCLLPTSTPQTTTDYVAWLIWIALPLGLMLWAWFLDGAQILARYSPLYARYFQPEITSSARWSRIFTLIILATCIFVPFARRSHMRLPSCAEAMLLHR